MAKLYILKRVLLAALWVAYLIKSQDRYTWLSHYIKGSGKERWVPAQLLHEVLPTLAREWSWACHAQGDELVKRVLTRAGWLYRVGFWSTTLYRGKGFSNRPECFYILGCFTYTVKMVRDPLEGKIVVIEGADKYDWHSTPHFEWSYDSEGNEIKNVTEQWYTSPTPKWFAWALGLIFGREYFPTVGFPMGEPGISNRLWADLEKVGAKPFKTRFSLTVPQEEWDRLKHLECDNCGRFAPAKEFNSEGYHTSCEE